ncbi:hypothetical protein K3495_g9964 [Podosphaera aphanis]|nr:hypothetical protein K3495_g9964 [Podosphaera aphanis]
MFIRRIRDPIKSVFLVNSSNRNVGLNSSILSYKAKQGITTFPQQSPISTPSKIRRAVRNLALGLILTSTAFIMTALPAFKVADEFLNPPTDKETLSLFTPDNDEAKEVEGFINSHSLSREMRSKPEFSESRPHLKIPVSQRDHNLTAGTLMGPGKIVVPPIFWVDNEGKSLVSIAYVGTDLCGYPGLVHGGFLATLLDEGLARCCFAALPNKVGLTANLNINYRAPVPAGTYIVLFAKTTKVEGRKAWVEGHLETLANDGEKPLLLAEASALFIEPRQAAAMAQVYPI